MIIVNEIKKIIANKEQAMNRYSDRAKIAMKYEIKILKQVLLDIQAYERTIEHYEKYDKQLEDENNKLSLENEDLKSKEGEFYYNVRMRQKDKYIKQLETENANLSKIIDDLKESNGDLFIKNNLLKEQVEYGRFYQLERKISDSALKMALESISIINRLEYENEELKIHIRSLIYEGKQYDNIDG